MLILGNYALVKIQPKKEECSPNGIVLPGSDCVAIIVALPPNHKRGTAITKGVNVLLKKNAVKEEVYIEGELYHLVSFDDFLMIFNENDEVTQSSCCGGNCC